MGHSLQEDPAEERSEVTAASRNMEEFIGGVQRTQTCLHARGFTETLESQTPR